MITGLPHYLKRPGNQIIVLKLAAFTFLVSFQTGFAELTGWQRYARTEAHMGTRFEIIAYCDSPDRCEAAFHEAFQVVAQLDAALSDYNPDSELTRFCLSAPHKEPIAISKSMHDVLLAAQEVSRKSDGAFDVTVGPLTKLWRRARRQKVLPSPERIQEEKALVGYQNLIVPPEEQTAQLKLSKMRIDLGAIAKGYAIDRALEAMRRHGIESALVNGGGDIAVGKAPPGRDTWRVQVFDGTETEIMVLHLSNQAVATSGDLYQFVEIDGRRYSHLVDPKTGIGLTRFVSSTVIAPTAMTADVWASALALMGPDRGLPLLEAMPNCEASIRLRGQRDEAQIDEKHTSGYPSRGS